MVKLRPGMHIDQIVWAGIKRSGVTGLTDEQQQFIAESIIETYDGFRSETAESYDIKITSQRLTLLQMIAAGLTNSEISTRMFLAEDTIKSYVRQLYGNLGAVNRSHAISLGFMYGLVKVEDIPAPRREPRNSRHVTARAFARKSDELRSEAEYAANDEEARVADMQNRSDARRVATLLGNVSVSVVLQVIRALRTIERNRSGRGSNDRRP